MTWQMYHEITLIKLTTEFMKTAVKLAKSDKQALFWTQFALVCLTLMYLSFTGFGKV